MRKLLIGFALSISLIIGNVEFGLTAPEDKAGYEFHGKKLYLDASLYVSYLKGDTTYRISFPGGASELEFPLKTYFIGPDIVWGFKNVEGQDTVRLKFRLLYNIGHGSGKMKDSDWIDDDESFLGIPGYNHPGKDIYSESDIDLSAYMIDLNFIYNFWPLKFFSLGPMVGYKYQYFKYDVSNTDQVGYDQYAPFFTVYVPGDTLKYYVSYSIPYFGLNSDILLGKKFRINLNAGYTPWASAKDRDDHLLRYKLSRGDTDGTAYLGSLNLSWHMFRHFVLTVGGEFLKIHTTGTQHQSFYAGPYVGWEDYVDDKITSKQWSILTMLTFRF